MKNRFTYIKKDLLEKFPDFIISRDNDEMYDFVRVRVKDFSILTLLKILYPLTTHESLTFSELYSISGIRMKATYLRYLNLSKSYAFVTRKELRRTPRRKPYSVEYRITERGRIFLALFLTKQTIEIQPPPT